MDQIPIQSSRMILRQAEIGPMANFIYLIGCTDTREAAVVDPAWDVEAILRLAGEADLRITHVLLTHSHPDHMNGLEGILEATDATVALHADETDYMKKVAEFFGTSLAFMGRRSGNFRALADGDTLRVGNLPLRILHTPGHTPGSQCFLVEGSLISGDTLFVDSCGRVDLPGGDPGQMYRSLQHTLRNLDDATILYPGHNYGIRPTSTMGDQKRTNPCLRYTSLDRFLLDMGA